MVNSGKPLNHQQPPVGDVLFKTTYLEHVFKYLWYIKSVKPGWLGRRAMAASSGPRCLLRSTRIFMSSLRYPLVNLQKTMERSTIFNGKTHYKWPFSIAMLVYQRVNGYTWRFPKMGGTPKSSKWPFWIVLVLKLMVLGIHHLKRKMWNKKYTSIHTTQLGILYFLKGNWFPMLFQ